MTGGGSTAGTEIESDSQSIADKGAASCADDANAKNTPNAPQNPSFCQPRLASIQLNRPAYV